MNKTIDLSAPRRRTLLLGAAAALALPGALAQDRWPSKPVKMIIPFPPGQATDIYGRVFAERLTRTWGQAVVVENRAGASSIIGMEAIKASAPDGYTLGMVSSGPLAINPAVFSKLAYDPRKDFTPISLAFIAPLVILVNNELPARNVAELVALLKAQPGRLSYASGGPGTSQHLAAELFKIATKTFAVHIPYKGSGPALTDLIGGQVQFMVDSVSAALGHIQAGRLRALAVTSLRRNASLPNVPTVAESGVPGLQNFEAVGWGGMVAPAGLPPAIAQKVTQDFSEVLRDDAVVQRVNGTGSVIRALPGAEFSKFIADEITKWTSAARASNTRLD
ncbi:MAG: putative Bug-like extracytoplasmic solute binding receptor, family [Ramlibacter sp.]|nr:putative Bug-like extracytoplasmic solute binding receptor, family [Ramlibacter sp.]